MLTFFGIMTVALAQTLNGRWGNFCGEGREQRLPAHNNVDGTIEYLCEVRRDTAIESAAGIGGGFVANSSSKKEQLSLPLPKKSRPILS